MTSTDGESGAALPVAASAEGEFSNNDWDPGSYLDAVRKDLLPLSLLPLRFRLRFRERTPSRSPYEFRKRPVQPRDGHPYMVVPSFFASSANTPVHSSPRKPPPGFYARSPNVTCLSSRLSMTTGT